MSRDKAAGKRLLIVDNDEAYFTSHRLAVASGARAAGYEVHVAIPLSMGEAPGRYPEFVFHDIPFDRSGTSIVRDIRTCRALLRLYRRISPDIVHHFSVKPVLYGGWAARLARVPVVINAMTGLGTLFSRDDARTRSLRAFAVSGLRLACRPANVRMIFQNAEDQAFFVARRICSPAASTVIPGSGVDIEQFQPAREPPGTPVVVFASRMLWAKGVGDFVAAAIRLHREGVQARFLLVGETDSNPMSVSTRQLQDWESQGAVEWCGHRADMPQVFREAHIVCLPSCYREGVPKVLVEAASSGRPVVTTDMPGCRDIISNEKNGIVVPPGDQDALVHALRRLIESESLRRQMGQYGRQRVLEAFSASVIVQKTLEVYAAPGGR